MKFDIYPIFGDFFGDFLVIFLVFFRELNVTWLKRPIRKFLFLKMAEKFIKIQLNETWHLPDFWWFFGDFLGIF